jgi:hypothetical protein
VHSDGRRTPAELAAGARAAGLDYIVSTEHNTSSASGVWGEVAGPDLLVIDGEEVTTRNGHYLALGLPAGTWIDWRYRAVDGVLTPSSGGFGGSPPQNDGALPRFVRDIHRVGGLAVAAHPMGACVGCSWKFGYESMDAVEVWNGPWDAEDAAVLGAWDNLLATGHWIPAVGNSDAHREPQVIGLPHNVVYADDLSRRAILAGVRAGRLWIAESSAVALTFEATAGGHRAGIGQRLEVAAGTPVTLTVDVRGADGCSVRLCTDQGPRHTATLPGPVTWRTTPRNSAYVRVEVRRPTSDSMVALTNPIFLGRRPMLG